MEISVGNSGGSKTKSLDLKALYKSEVSNKGEPVKKETSSWLGNGEGAEAKKRKNRNEVAISSFEDLAERKKVKHGIDDIEVDGADSCSAQSSGLAQKINGGAGLNAIGVNISSDSHGVLIPKRPRGTVGRSKFAKSHLLKPSASSDSVEKVTKLKDEVNEDMQDEVSGRDEPMDSKEASSAEQIIKLNGNNEVDQKGVVDSKGTQKQESTTVTSNLHAKNDKPDVSLEIPQENVSSADAHLNSSSLGSEDEVSELKKEIDEIPQGKVPGADASLSSNSTSADQMGKSNGNSKGLPRNNVKRKGIIDGKPKEDSAAVDLEKGEGTEKDSSSKRNRSSHRKRKYLGSGNESPSVEKKVGACDLDPDDDLEQNAARMLSSRFDPSCIGFASKNRTCASAELSVNGGESLSEKPTASDADADADAADRVLRPRRQQKGKGGSRKRRHFYEVHSDDMDAHWFLNRRIKIFWPLDESWYYGLVNDYDAEKNLHHIKYDDRDEEWISLENERFKLLLLPCEVPQKPSLHKDTDTHKKDKGSRSFHIKDEAFMATHMESEPIISWLARPSHRAKSSPLKKQKQSQSHVVDRNMLLLERETDKPNCTSVFLSTSKESSNSSEGHLPIVYVRRRNRRFSDASCIPFVAWSLNSAGGLKLDTTLIESKKFEICISLWPMLTYVLGADILWLFSRVLLLQYGTMVAMWPTVFMEVLFVDNIVGLRLFLFEGCLKQAVTFVFLVMKVFCEAEKDESTNHQVPVTSIRFKLSFFQNFRKEKVFAYYSFSKVRDSNWRYLDSELQPHCLLTKQLSLPECTYDNVKLLEAGTQESQIPFAAQTAYFEVFHKKPNPGAVISSSPRSPCSPAVLGSRPSTIYSLKNGNLPPFALSFSAAPNFFLSMHLKLLLERSIDSLSLQDHDSLHPPQDTFHQHADADDDDDESLSGGSPAIDEGPRKPAQLVLDPISISSKSGQISVEIPTSDEVYMDCQKTPGADVAWNLSDDIICSPNPTAPKSLWNRDGKADFIGNGFSNGPKKPRTQVQYTLPCREFNFKNKGGHSQTGLPYQRIRRANEKKTPGSDSSSKGPRRNLELVACDANILINGGDKGWRECGARVFLEVADQNEWKLAVKCSGVLKYAHKVHQDLQPGSTNRYTHAMMWKGGKDWTLEFPDRGQWVLFKEMHEECHNRNIRAASIKNIPIPGVRLIEDLVDDQEEAPFVRSSWYFRQVRNDVEMAMDGSHVMYDMDSEDEEWVCRSRSRENEMISDEVFEKVMDMLEKLSYAQKRDHFTSGEIEELIARVTPMQAAKTIYEHWREKRQRKGMPLIRHLQPPLWERYQQICREWDQSQHSQPKLLTTGALSGSQSQSQEKASASASASGAADDKPPMFAFCLKPRGLELLNKGSKHRPHKKISLSGHSHAFLADHDTPTPHHASASGRRVNTYVLGDDRADSSDVSPLLSRMYSPTGPGHFSLDGDASDWNHQLRLQRNTSKTIKPLISPRPCAPPSTFRKPGKRNNGNGKKPNNLLPDWRNHPSPPYRHPGQLLLGGSDLDEFRLRDASSAAKHARNMAKLKRERAQKLMLSADLAIHKAVSALMTAEAIKAMNE
ncbi:unnamed protein product [Lactuca saligna]|uniref:Enhancer of polycomb-like protein n=1 Tax=Lactuca saligna TaxID=75948 RepID=A0AA35Z2D1_LACSI|nr:unnamed protein product [Lactuca saligna]